MIYPQNFEQKIGFDQIRQLLKDKCLSTLGEERVSEMSFSGEYEEVEEKLNQVTEFVRIIQEEDSFPDQFFFDVRPSLKRVRIEGMYLDEQELFDLRRSLETIRDIVRFLHQDKDEESGTPYPCLKRLAGDIAVFPQLIGKIDNILNKYGKIKDNASAELARIRRELANTMGSISRSLNNILRNAQSEGYVDKDVAPTMRDGRLVIPVAPGLKRKIKGIVHDESASGKTVFIEPAEVVEANNRVRELEGDEKREIIRILTEFSNILRPSIPEILQSYEFLAEIDFIRAKSHFAIQTDSLKPTVENTQMLDWTMAVHPLLQLSLAKHGKKVVPLDIELNQKQRILIISGPNAGGKSVCLKTVGLLQYMLQCGMPVPLHERSHAGIFHSIFIDIGDEQSIEDDLSTYSSHLTNMKMMMKNCNGQSLILIDEFGGGTEPQIGGAIAEAVLKRFNQKGTFGVITTHYQNLKHFAEDHEGIVNGAMLYDRHLMQALFQLQIGNPGSSFAVEIARCLGNCRKRIHQCRQIPPRHRTRQTLLGRKTPDHPPTGKTHGRNDSPLPGRNGRTAEIAKRDYQTSERRSRTNIAGIKRTHRKHHPNDKRSTSGKRKNPFGTPRTGRLPRIPGNIGFQRTRRKNSAENGKAERETRTEKKQEKRTENYRTSNGRHF